MRKTIQLCLAMMLVVMGAATAQSRAGVQGVVTDSSKNELPGVTITLTNQQSKTVSKAVTNTSGRYQFEVPAGMYEISADLKGFQMQRLAPLEVKEGATLSQDFVMIIAPRN
jgi:Carboxypeptidase regulatory-like domain